jgi:hypothetical protein
MAAPILNFHRDVVAVIAVAGTTQYVRDPVGPGQLQLLRSCAQAVLLKLNSHAYAGLGVPMLQDFNVRPRAAA